MITIAQIEKARTYIPGAFAHSAATIMAGIDVNGNVNAEVTQFLERLPQARVRRAAAEKKLAVKMELMRLRKVEQQYNRLLSWVDDQTLFLRDYVEDTQARNNAMPPVQSINLANSPFNIIRVTEKTLIVETKQHVIIRDVNPAAGVNMTVNFGIIRLSIDLRRARVRALPTPSNISARSLFPTCFNDRSVCLGSISYTFAEQIQNMKYKEALDDLYSTLVTISDNPATSMGTIVSRGWHFSNGLNEHMRPVPPESVSADDEELAASLTEEAMVIVDEMADVALHPYQVEAIERASELQGRTIIGGVRPLVDDADIMAATNYALAPIAQRFNGLHNEEASVPYETDSAVARELNSNEQVREDIFK